ncbi:MAG TPA: TonB family protein [Candidatus Sulfotelmatobacter sp.]|jgi:TonB family protein
MRRSIWLSVWLLSAVVAVAVTTPSPRVQAATFDQRESQVSTTLSRASQFVDVPHISSRPACEEVQPPEALTTPDPLYTRAGRGQKVKVSFIIGTDGRVHSPLILESAGLAGDRHVLQTVRTWRYRPATCNGVPTETEGKIEFSSR